jgi:branched-chain amino acid transport system permease protein
MTLILQLLFNSLVTASIYAFVTVGLYLTYGLLGVIQFAHGHLMLLGAYFFFWFRYQHSLSFSFSLLATLALAVPATLIVDKVFIKPFVRYSPLVVFVATLTLSIFIESFIAFAFGVDVKSLGSELSYSGYQFCGIYVTMIQLVIITSALIFLPLFILCITYTPFGRRLRALAKHPYAAQSLNIPHQFLLFSAITVSTAFAFCAGIMVGYETSIFPTMAYSYTVKAFAALVLGGLGSIGGAVVGCLVLAILENFCVGIDIFGYSLPAGYRDAFSFIVILSVLLFRRQGIGGKSIRSS